MENVHKIEKEDAMTKEVWISIRGLQYIDEEGQEPVEVICSGEYFHRNGKHYVLYEEAQEGLDQMVKNRLKISPDSVEMTKKGSINTQMIFREGVRHQSCYDTVYGPLMLGVRTHRISCIEQTDAIDLQMEYTLDIREAPMADCTMSVRIWPRQTALEG